jgi:tRNA(Ile)-lysidine synthase TilS/MesJ
MSEVTYYCGDCEVNWSPHHCNGGACPECGSGTKRHTTEPISDDAWPRAELAKVEQAFRERQDAFELYYTERQLTRAFAPLLPDVAPG